MAREGHMAKARITKRLVDTLKPTMSDFTVFDTVLVGFGVRVRATGGMSYIVQYKGGTGRGAPTRRVTLGGVGKMTPDPQGSNDRLPRSNASNP